MRSLVAFLSLATTASCLVFLPSACGQAFKEASVSDSGADHSIMAGDENAPAPDVAVPDVGDVTVTPPDAGCNASTDFKMDSANCGGCGHQCRDTQGCTAGLCSLNAVAKNLANPSGLAVDPLGNAFVGVNGTCNVGLCASGTVMGYALGMSGSPVSSSPIRSSLEPGIAVVLADTELYWAGSSTIGTALLSTKPKPIPEPIPAPPLTTEALVGLAADGQYLYVASSAGSIYYAPAGDLTPSWQALYTNSTGSAQVSAMTVGPSETVFWANKCTGSCASMANTGSIITTTVASDSSDTSVNNQATPTGIAVADKASLVFWANTSAGTIESAGLNLTAPKPKVAVNAPTAHPFKVAADADGAVYWTDGAGNVNVRYPNGDPIKLATGQSDPGAIAISDDRVFWVNAGASGSVYWTWR
jgi:hypothetical protein